MLDIGLSELLLIAVVALIVIGPKDLPAVVRHGAKFLREMREVYSGLKRQMTEVMDEVGASDIKREMTTIIDLEGKPQPAFDVRELEWLKQSPVVSVDDTRTVVPPPLGGRLGGGLACADADYYEPTNEQVAPPPQPSPYRGGSDSAFGDSADTLKAVIPQRITKP